MEIHVSLSVPPVAADLAQVRGIALAAAHDDPPGSSATPPTSTDVPPSRTSSTSPPTTGASAPSARTLRTWSLPSTSSRSTTAGSS
ncbi:hypothetical protein [Methanoculleus chikugoensis]|uniref:hypothetical protein n=1 Tax=Methanoculleus chikugoensis TaxID=118126 RepID=UPI001FB33775|nr:hypothetical protein [Methanoculleus chikugoensis]